MDSMRVLLELEQQDGAPFSRHPLRSRGDERSAGSGDPPGGGDRQAAALEVYPIDAAEVRRRMPYMNADDVIAASFCPTDGYLSPGAGAVVHRAAGGRASTCARTRRSKRS